jgi:hypothetical protein
MTFKPNFKTLPKNQQLMWSHLSPAKDMGFCLYGGTALALRFGHRLSVDFDFFSSLPLDKVGLTEHFPMLKDSQVLQESPNSYIALTIPPAGTEPVKLSFFGNIGFGRVGTPELSDDGVILVASIRDLMATKLKALFDRVELKDYLDIAEMIQASVSLTDGICDARALFPTFNSIYCLKTLCYFDMDELKGLPGKQKKILEQSVLAIPHEQEFRPTAIHSLSLILTPAELAKEMSRVQARIKSR